MDWRQNALRAYRALLYAYPGDFRHEYAKEMEHLFARRLEAEPAVRLWLDTITDLAITAPREHMHVALSDVRQSARLLINTPGFAFTALITVALGIAAAATVFSLVDAVLIRPLPYGNPRRLFYMWTPVPSVKELPPEIAPPYADVFAWRQMSRSFEDITALQIHTFAVAGRNSIPVSGALILGNFFHTLKAAPEMGRVLDSTDDEPGQARVAVISDALWRSKLAGDPDAIGKEIQLDWKNYRVVGLMRPEFTYPHETDFPGALAPTLKRTDVWIPSALTLAQKSDRVLLTNEPDLAIGRLRSEVSFEQAQSEMSAIEKRLAPLNTEFWQNVQSLIAPFSEATLGPVRPLLRLLGGAVFLVLMLACSNLAHVLLARAADRAHELGVRAALGAERGRLVRLLLTESLIVSIAGGVLGTLFTFAAVKIVAKLNPGDIPRFEQISINGHVLLFCLLASAGTGVAAGLGPGLCTARVNVQDWFRRGGRGIAGGSWRARIALIVAEVAMSVVLLAGAGLLIRSYLVVLNEDKGFAASTLTMNLTVTNQQKRPVDAVAVRAQEQQLAALSRDVLRRIRSLPGVRAAGAIDDLPLSHSEDVELVNIEGQQQNQSQVVDIRHVSGEYFQAMRIPLRSGRFLEDRDVLGDPELAPPAVVVSESFARRYFPNRNAVGLRLKFDKERWSSIVGVVGDVRHSSLEQAPKPTVYWPSCSLARLQFGLPCPRP